MNEPKKWDSREITTKCNEICEKFFREVKRKRAFGFFRIHWALTANNLPVTIRSTDSRFYIPGIVTNDELSLGEGGSNTVYEFIIYGDRKGILGRIPILDMFFNVFDESNRIFALYIIFKCHHVKGTGASKYSSEFVIEDITVKCRGSIFKQEDVYPVPLDGSALRSAYNSMLAELNSYFGVPVKGFPVVVKPSGKSITEILDEARK